MRKEQYQTVTDRIIAQLEAGVRPWHQTWSAFPGGGRPLRYDGQKYRGANVLNLWSAGMARGFSSPYWLTFRKVQELGASVRKGAKAEISVYVGSGRAERERNGEVEEYGFTFLKATPVFNPAEIDGLASHYYEPARVGDPLPDSERRSDVDQWVANTGAKITEAGSRAFFRPSTDEIHMPPFASFESASAFYGTEFHELTHWTGAEKRLNRAQKGIFGNPEYAFEELVAELGAAYLCADLRIDSEPRPDHASYIASWLKALKADNRAIFKAATAAESAAGYLHSAKADTASIAA